MHSLETIVGFGAALTALATAGMLWMPAERRPVQVRFALLLVSLAVTLILRVVDQGAPHPVVTWLTFTSFSLFPLFSVLFVEEALPAGAPLPLKLVLLAGVVSFPVAGLIPAVLTSQAYLLAVGVWHIVVFALLLGFLGWSIAVAETPYRRASATALTVGAGLSVIALANDWAAAFDLGPTRVGAALLVVVFYVVAESLYASERFRARRALVNLLVAAGLAVAATALLFLVDASRDRWAQTASTLFFLFVGLLPLRAAWRAASMRRRATLNLRLSGVPTGSIEETLAAFRHWPELRRVVLLDSAQLAADGLAAARRLVLAQPGVLDRAGLMALAGRGAAHEILGVEQALHLLASQELDAITGVDDDGAILGVAFTAMVPGEGHRQLVGTIGFVCQLVLRGQSTRALVAASSSSSSSSSASLLEVPA